MGRSAAIQPPRRKYFLKGAGMRRLRDKMKRHLRILHFLGLVALVVFAILASLPAPDGRA